VRNANESQKQTMQTYLDEAAKEGHKVYYPATDTNQDDPVGYRICTDNKNAIIQADEVVIFWDKTSQGSLFDLGMAFALNKPLTIINLDSVEKTEGKSFSNMICEWQRVSR
jgi:nucleoside 2-deoxyribosyltransferase